MSAINQKLLIELLESFLLSKHFAISEVKKPNNQKLISAWSKHFTKAKLDRNEALWHTFSFNNHKHYSGEHAIKKI